MYPIPIRRCFGNSVWAHRWMFLLFQHQIPYSGQFAAPPPVWSRYLPCCLMTPCGRSYLEPATSVATKVGTGRLSGHPRPPGDGGDSWRRRLGYDEPDAGQA